MTLLRMSLIGAGMILTIVLLRLLLQQRVHRNVFLALWLIAALRLLVPVFIPTGLEVALPPQSEESFAAAAVRTMVQPTQPAASGSTLWRVLPWVWLAVAVGLLLFFSLSHLRLRRTFRFSVPMPEEAGLCANVRMLDGLGSPLTYGVFRPVILLPASFDWRDRQQLTQVLLHENAHIRYRDVSVKALLVLACCLHWFNPAVWLMLVWPRRIWRCAVTRRSSAPSGGAASSAMPERSWRRSAAAEAAAFCRRASRLTVRRGGSRPSPRRRCSR